METMTEAREAATEAIKEQFGPVLDSVEEKRQQARRALIRGRRAAEDLVAETRMQVRRRPLRAIAIATGVGALVGCVIGFAIEWRTHRAE